MEHFEALRPILREQDNASIIDPLRQPMLLPRGNLALSETMPSSSTLMNTTLPIQPTTIGSFLPTTSHNYPPNRPILSATATPLPEWRTSESLPSLKVDIATLVSRNQDVLCRSSASRRTSNVSTANNAAGSSGRARAWTLPPPAAPPTPTRQISSPFPFTAPAGLSPEEERAHLEQLLAQKQQEFHSLAQQLGGGGGGQGGPTQTLAGPAVSQSWPTMMPTLTTTPTRPLPTIVESPLQAACLASSSSASSSSSDAMIQQLERQMRELQVAASTSFEAQYQLSLVQQQLLDLKFGRNPLLLPQAMNATSSSPPLFPQQQLGGTSLPPQMGGTSSFSQPQQMGALISQQSLSQQMGTTSLPQQQTMTAVSTPDPVQRTQAVVTQQARSPESVQRTLQGGNGQKLPEAKSPEMKPQQQQQQQQQQRSPEGTQRSLVGQTPPRSPDNAHQNLQRSPELTQRALVGNTTPKSNSAEMAGDSPSGAAVRANVQRSPELAKRRLDEAAPVPQQQSHQQQQQTVQTATPAATNTTSSPPSSSSPTSSSPTSLSSSAALSSSSSSSSSVDSSVEAPAVAARQAVKAEAVQEESKKNERRNLKAAIRSSRTLMGAIQTKPA